MTNELEQMKAAAVRRLEEEARSQAAEDRRIYLEGMGFLYLIAVLLTASDAANLAGALDQAAADAPPVQTADERTRAELLAEDRAMVGALRTCQAALLEAMPQLAGPVLASCRDAAKRVNADEPFRQVVEAVGPHGLVYLAASFSAARIAVNAAGAAPVQERRH